MDGIFYHLLVECRLEKVLGNPHVYKNLDAFGGMEMPCPVGTIFNATGCQCSPDLLILEPKPTSACITSLFIYFSN